MQKFHRYCKYLFLLMLMLSTRLMYGQGAIQGVIKDSLSQEPLFGANVVVTGTSQGASTDFEGKFKIPNVATGAYKLQVSYLGYQSKVINVQVKNEQRSNLTIILSPVAVSGTEVVITAQALGQLAAINEQLSSNKMINAISYEKMKELPDANIAESIGRLPGISLERNAGEAYAVVVRGLSPQYNQVTIEGIPMTSTNSSDRSVDLSLLSDDLVKGVEVSKTLEANMDANALGGTVNLSLKTALPGFHFNINGNGAYTDLRATYKNYKVAGSISDRFFDDAFGVLIQGNIEEKSLPSDQFNAGYASPVYDSQNKSWSVQTSSATLTESNLKRNRYGVSAMLDYTSSFVDIKLFNVLDIKVDSNKIRNNTSNFTSGTFTGKINVNKYTTTQSTNSLQANFKFWDTELPVSLSYTNSSQKAPNNLEFDFMQSGGPSLPNSAIIYGDPLTLMKMMGVMDPRNSNSFMNYFFFDNASLNDHNFDAKADWKVPFKYSDLLSGTFSVGGKFNTDHRASTSVRYNLPVMWGFVSSRTNLINAFPFLTGVFDNSQYGIPAYPFVDPTYVRSSMLGYPLGPNFNIDRLAYMENTYYGNNPSAYWSDGLNNYNRRYTDDEQRLAGYAMVELKVGKDLTVVPGVRYQDEITDISAYHIVINTSNQNGITGNPLLVDTKRNFPAWFPSLNAKYKATDAIQLMAAAYRSESLPSFGDINPMVLLLEGANQTVTGNPVLKPSTSWNFDLGGSIYENYVGLFSVSLFYKDIANLIYAMQNYYFYNPYPIQNAPSDLASRLPSDGFFDRSWATTTTRKVSYTSIPVNDPYNAYLRGIEFSWQTHLWYLPGVLSGIVLDLNLTFMSSNQLYPYFALKPKKSILAPDTLVFSSTGGSLQNQPSAIYNAIVGWDYQGFSSRVSFRYQQKTLTSMDTRFGLENSYYDNFLLIDVSLKQKIDDKLSVFANANNISKNIDNYYYSHPAYTSSTLNTSYSAGTLPTSKQTYGWTLQFGLSYSY